ncbi:MAG: hypothetical protein GY947_01140 [Rhodobacteraceae bacterium]|nr:hypothetical protein [Paracoccaceae bacterium]
MKRLLTTLILLALALPVTAQDTRKLHPVAGDVYLFQNNFHMSLIVKTPEGTVRVDPINAEAGAWLNDNLASIGAGPVSHLIYSHSHADHASGGSAHPGAITIAHENAPVAIDGTEIAVRVGQFASLAHGGKTIEMTYVGPGHGQDMLAIVVRPENVGFIVDIAAPKRMFFRNMGGANLDDWKAQIATAQGLDFEIFAPGHGIVGTKADLDDVMTYMNELETAVLAGLQAGKTSEDLQAELELDAYKDWIQYDAWFPMNVEGMAAHLKATGKVN